MNREKETVFVGLSGGVDSSVSAKRLIDAGFDVVGVFIKTWHPDFLVCNWEAERLDAMRVASHLQIPFLTCDAEDAYKSEVAEYMIQEYKEGRTPNPDVMCNQYVKFGAFLKFAMEKGATKIATGHYAQVTEANGLYQLHRGIDAHKDQSYFLWTLTQEQLSKIYFPVGDTVKSIIREEAQKAGLPTFAKVDSQGICFLGQVDIKEFLSHYVTTGRGDVLNELGEVIGSHEGALYYTLGQRHGFTIVTSFDATVPHYVVGKDIAKNTITVSPQPTTISTKGITTLSYVNTIQGDFPKRCEAQFRYRQKPFMVTVTKSNDTTVCLSDFDTNIETPSLGQSCVLYSGDVCLGGGIISAVG